MQLNIDVVSDVVCPWCFIGKRRLEQALSALPGRPGLGQVEVRVRWRPFQLNPQLPEAGMDRAQYIEAKFGRRADDIYSRVADVGKQVGIEFAFDRIPRQPNTIPAHLLIRQAASGGHQDAMVESLFRGYFLEGADLTSREVLSQLAERAGLSAADAGQARSDPLLRRALGEEEQTARRLGVEGVPFFIIGGRVGVSGAQEPEVLLRAIEQATAETAVPAELF